MARLKLSMAMDRYDRMWPLFDGTVQAEGMDLNIVPLFVGETFWRQLHHRPEFDVCELSLSGYLITLERKPPTYIAIPVFPSRAFRHSSIYVGTGSGIGQMRDLAGKRIGIPEYSMTAAVWVRGMLQDDGVDIKSIRYIRGGELGYVEEERVELDLPSDISIMNAPHGKTLSSMLEAGELDAIIAPIPPACYLRRSPKVRRLFPDWENAEREYYRRTRFFPVMHTVAIRREIYERDPWIATSLYKAFEQAKAVSYQWLTDEGAMKYSMPWFIPHIVEQWRFFGCDPYEYGVETNRKLLDTVTRYSFEQGLTHRKLSVDELFAPETYDLYAGQLRGIDKIPVALRQALSNTASATP
jgi:4,5-dihydroxyphthalate decarboxylase